MSDEHHFNNFGELFNEINYAYEPHGAVLHYTDGTLEKVVFHKLSLTSDGKGQYKTSYYTFDPALWPKVVSLYKLLAEE